MFSRRTQVRIRRYWRQAKSLAILILVFTAVRSSLADWNDVPTGSMKPSILEGDRIYVNKLAYDLKVPFTTVRLARWSAPKRGDVVVFYSPEDGTRLVKRVVAIPGDTVAMRNEVLYINGAPCEYGPLDPKYANAAALADASERELLWNRDRDHIATEAKTESLPGGDRHPIMIHENTRAAEPAQIPSAPGQPGPFGVRKNVAPTKVPDASYCVMGDNRDNSKDSRFIGFVPMNNIVGRSSAVVLSLDIHHNWKPRWSRFFLGLP